MLERGPSPLVPKDALPNGLEVQGATCSIGDASLAVGAGRWSSREGHVTQLSTCTPYSVTDTEREL